MDLMSVDGVADCCPFRFVYRRFSCGGSCCCNVSIAQKSFPQKDFQPVCFRVFASMWLFPFDIHRFHNVCVIFIIFSRIITILTLIFIMDYLVNCFEMLIACFMLFIAFVLRPCSRIKFLRQYALSRTAMTHDGHAGSTSMVLFYPPSTVVAFGN